MKKIIIFTFIVLWAYITVAQSTKVEYIQNVMSVCKVGLTITSSELTYMKNGQKYELMYKYDTNDKNISYELKTADNMLYGYKHKKYYITNNNTGETREIIPSRKQKEVILANPFLSYYTGKGVPSMIAKVNAAKTTVMQQGDIIEYRYYNSRYKTDNIVQYNNRTHEIVKYECINKKTGQTSEYLLQDSKLAMKQSE